MSARLRPKSCGVDRARTERGGRISGFKRRVRDPEHDEKAVISGFLTRIINELKKRAGTDEAPGVDRNAEWLAEIRDMCGITGFDPYVQAARVSYISKGLAWALFGQL
ncbi:MAG: hypothetical protein AB7D36_11490 [Oscillospiraceae bacterium]